MLMYLFEFFVSLIMTHFEYMSSCIALLESCYVYFVTQFESLLFLILRHNLRRKLLNQAVPAR